MIPSLPDQVLQQPEPPDPAAPFVGNVTTDDNIAECVRAALWAILGNRHHEVMSEVSDGLVTLSGTLAGADEQSRCRAAVRGLAGVVDVIDRTRFHGARGQG